MLSPIILTTAVLNGLLTGAVYALVALGLTLIYGVLHIINFAHGALLTAAIASSTWNGHIMSYGPTKFVEGQNEGAAPCNTQVQGHDIKVILPTQFADGKAIFPMKA